MPINSRTHTQHTHTHTHIFRSNSASQKDLKAAKAEALDANVEASKERECVYIYSDVCQR